MNVELLEAVVCHRIPLSCTAYWLDELPPTVSWYVTGISTVFPSARDHVWLSIVVTPDEGVEYETIADVPPPIVGVAATVAGEPIDEPFR
jgi:hypothetical protein